MKLKNSSASFCIVCAHQNVYYATINSNDDIILGEMKVLGQPNQTNAVIVEVDGQLNVITYIVDSNYSVNVYSDASPATYSLPSNIICASEPILHPIPAHEAFIVHCTSSSILYIVQIPIDSDQRALSIQADGYPHVNNMYIVIVNGNKATTHTIDDLDKAGRPIIFQTDIEIIRFLNDYNMQVLTKNEHIVVNLKNTSLKPRYMEGRPTLYQWVDESNDYIYVTESNGVYTIRVVNDSSTKAMYGRGGIAEQPQSLLYIRSSKSNDDGGPNLPNTPWYKEKVAKILYGIVTVIVVLAIFSIILVPLLWRRWRKHSCLRRIASYGRVHYQATDTGGVITLDRVHIVTTLPFARNDPTVEEEATDIPPTLPSTDPPHLPTDPPHPSTDPPHPSTDPPHSSTTSPPPSTDPPHSSTDPPPPSTHPTTDNDMSPSTPSTANASPQPPPTAKPSDLILPPDNQMNVTVIDSDPSKHQDPSRTTKNITYDPSTTTHEESVESDDDNDKTPLLSTEPYSINVESIYKSSQQATGYVPTVVNGSSVSSEDVGKFNKNVSHTPDSSALSSNFMEAIESSN